MPSSDDSPEQTEPQGGMFAPQCGACRSAFKSADRTAVSFLLVETLTVPLIGCDDHLEQFRSICGLTTEKRAKLLKHAPAGGLPCPGCRHASYNTQHPIIPLNGGALALLTCSTHQADIITRFRTGLRTQGQLTSSLDSL
jgi:hypothetical protein